MTSTSSPHARPGSRALLVVALTARAAGAQSTPPPAPADSGALLRLTAPGLPIAGRPVTLDAPWGDPLVVRDADGQAQTRVPLASVQRVEVRRRATSGDAARGARIGALVGLAPSAVLIPLAVREDRRCVRDNGFFCGLASAAAGFSAVLLTGVGAGIGAIAGHNARPLRWELAWLPVRTTDATGATGATGRASLRMLPLVPVPTRAGAGVGRGVGLAVSGRF